MYIYLQFLKYVEHCGLVVQHLIYDQEFVDLNPTWVIGYFEPLDKIHQKEQGGADVHTYKHQHQ